MKQLTLQVLLVFGAILKRGTECLGMRKWLKTPLSLCLFGISLIILNHVFLEHREENEGLNSYIDKHRHNVRYQSIGVKSFRKQRNSFGVKKHVSNEAHTTFLDQNGKTTDNYLEMELPPFLPDYKNPCFRKKKGQLRCLPYFQLLGNDKCGTTDLYHRILQHPNVIPNNGVLGKETYFWGWHMYGRHLQQEIPVGHFNKYLKHFSEAVSIIENTTDEKTGYHYKVTGDGTPVTFWDLGGWPRIPQNNGLQEPKYLTPHIIKHIMPNCKLIVIFRNPTERTYTDYHFLNYRKKSSKESFHKDVLTSLNLFWECTRIQSIRMCAFDWQLLDQMPVRIHVSLYSLHLKEWLKVYDLDELLILRTEDYAKDIAGTINKTIQYLELDSLSDSKLRDIASMEKIHKTEHRYKAGEMLESTRELLDEFYAPFNEQLANILGDRRFLWK